METDTRVDPLVNALNRLPGIHTILSCGGHDDPTSHQCPSDEFSVSFTVERTRKGWKSLELVEWAAHKTDFEHLLIYLWNQELDVPKLAFEIYGIDGVEPNTLAKTLVDLTSIENFS